MTAKDDDVDYLDAVLTRVEALEEAGDPEVDAHVRIFYLRTGIPAGTQHEMSLTIPTPPFALRIGEPVRLYLAATSAVRGLDINGRTVFYRTESEERVRQAEELRRARIEVWGSEDPREKYRDAYAKVPEEVRAVLPAFQDDATDARLMFAAVEATRLLARANTLEALDRAEKLLPDELSREIPALSHDHSGGTFALVLQIARSVVRQREQLGKTHREIDGKAL